MKQLVHYFDEDGQFVRTEEIEVPEAMPSPEERIAALEDEARQIRDEVKQIRDAARVEAAKTLPTAKGVAQAVAGPTDS